MFLKEPRFRGFKSLKRYTLNGRLVYITAQEGQTHALLSMAWLFVFDLISFSIVSNCCVRKSRTTGIYYKNPYFTQPKL